jgi:hypothetical protein
MLVNAGKNGWEDRIDNGDNFHHDMSLALSGHCQCPAECGGVT